jgi:hypothetical protein
MRVPAMQGAPNWISGSRPTNGRVPVRGELVLVADAEQRVRQGLAHYLLAAEVRSRQLVFDERICLKEDIHAIRVDLLTRKWSLDAERFSEIGLGFTHGRELDSSFAKPSDDEEAD